MISVTEICQQLQQPIPTNASELVSGFYIDSRQLMKGGVFCALVGDKVDGHAYISEVLAKGASLVLASQVSIEHERVLQVIDVHNALLNLAQYWRQQLSAKVIALTGSNGKTTIKNTLHTLLSTAGKCTATSANQNNELGVPLTLLAAPIDSDFVVVEIGARRLGDIAYLNQLVRPDVAFVANIGQAHLGIFGGLLKLLQAKSEILQNLAANALVLLDIDSPQYDYFKAVVGSKGHVATISSHDANADLCWRYEQANGYSHFRWQDSETQQQHLSLSLPLLGKHNAHNVAWALLVGIKLGLTTASMHSALQTLQSEPGRLQLITINNTLELLDDSYNASPESVAVACHVLAQRQGHKWLVLADMLELGDASEALHQQLQPLLLKLDLQRLYLFGAACHSLYKKLQSTTLAHKCQWFAQKSALLTALEVSIQQRHQCVSAHKHNLSILFKGSNSMNLQQLIYKLQQNFCEQNSS